MVFVLVVVVVFIVCLILFYIVMVQVVLDVQQVQVIDFDVVILGSLLDFVMVDIEVEVLCSCLFVGVVVDCMGLMGVSEFNFQFQELGLMDQFCIFVVCLVNVLMLIQVVGVVVDVIFDFEIVWDCVIIELFRSLYVECSGVFYLIDVSVILVLLCLVCEIVNIYVDQYLIVQFEEKFVVIEWVNEWLNGCVEILCEDVCVKEVVVVVFCEEVGLFDVQGVILIEQQIFDVNV